MSAGACSKHACPGARMHLPRKLDYVAMSNINIIVGLAYCRGVDVSHLLDTINSNYDHLYNCCVITPVSATVSCQRRREAAR